MKQLPPVIRKTNIAFMLTMEYIYSPNVLQFAAQNGMIKKKGKVAIIWQHEVQM